MTVCFGKIVEEDLLRNRWVNHDDSNERKSCGLGEF